METMRYGILAILIVVFLVVGGCGDKQKANVVVVKESTRLVPIKDSSVSGFACIKRVTVKNVGNKDAKNVIISTILDPDDADWKSLNNVETIKYLAQNDKETVEIVGAYRYWYLRGMMPPEPIIITSIKYSE
ncbi:hypothetical protein ACFL2Q_16445 [Thermodesulfobacteriota bacterium]